jgi:hypothetical protein
MRPPLTARSPSSDSRLDRSASLPVGSPSAVGAAHPRAIRAVDFHDVPVIRPERRGGLRRRSSECCDRAVEEAQHDGRVRWIVTVERAQRMRPARPPRGVSLPRRRSSCPTRPRCASNMVPQTRTRSGTWSQNPGVRPRPCPDARAVVAVLLAVLCRTVGDRSKEVVERGHWSERMLVAVDEVERMHPWRSKDHHRSDPEGPGLTIVAFV